MKVSAKLIELTASLCVILSSVPYCTSAYDYQCDFTLNEILDSEIKPKITVESECISFDEAKANPVRTISISVDYANLRYSSTGLHIYYDKRLELVNNKLGQPYIEIGSAWQYLTPCVPKIDPTATEQDMKGFFICSASKIDSGLDGVMCSFKLQLPDEVQPGDVYPIDIIYKSVPSAKDLFTNAKDDRTGQLMQAYTFTYGIYNGVTSKFVPVKEDLQRCENLYFIDSACDGYIAIKDAFSAVETTTTTTPATTTTITTTTITTPATTTTTTTKTTTTTPATTTNITTTTITTPTTTTTTTTKTTTTTTTTTTATAIPSLVIVPSEVNMTVGDTNKLAIAGAPDISDVAWTSGNTSVATVDENGKVTAKKAGNAKIYAVYKGIIAECNIKVSDKYITYGDANNDSKLNIADATAIIQHIGNQDEYCLSDAGLVNADVNGDGQVTGMDAIIIQEVIAGIHKAEDLPLKKP